MIQSQKKIFQSKRLAKSYFDMGRQFFFKSENSGKNKMHTIRCMRMSIEFLKTGRINIDRTNIDAEELLSIRNEDLCIDHIVLMLESDYSDLIQSSDMPDDPDYEAIEALTVKVLKLKLFDTFDKEKTYRFDQDYLIDGKFVPFPLIFNLFVSDFQQFYIRKALNKAKGSITHAAPLIDISRRSMYNILYRYNMK
jgi:hypothetical protein